MKCTRILAMVAAAGAVLVPAAGSAAAAPARTLLNGHISIGMVDGALPVGAGISVIHHCPKGSDLDEAETRAVGEFHDGRLRVASREYWPAGMVVRYQVTKKMHADDEAMVATAALCKSRVAADATRFTAAAKVDLRVWGPAPREVGLTDVALVVVTDDLNSDYIFRTSMRAAGVDSHPASLRSAVDAVQETLTEGDESAVIAVGRTNRKVGRGEFVSMRNNYRFTARLDEKLTW